tara:strand:- start:999 stop:2921 length:1923 start_codon:yes stop_codon:yes gene_type:complete
MFFSHIFFNLIQRLINTNKLIKRLVLIFLDSVAIISIILISFSLRLDYLYFPNENLFYFIFMAPLIGIPIFQFYNLYNSVIRYIGFRSLYRVVKAVTLYAFTWGLLGYMLGLSNSSEVLGVPRSVIIINWLLCIIGIGGLRIFANWLVNGLGHNKKVVIIYGAGSAGSQLSNLLRTTNEYRQVAFVDNNKNKIGEYINGISVQSVENLTFLIKKYNVSEVLIAIPSLSRLERKKIIDSFSEVSILVRSLPSLSKIADGKVKIEDLLEIDIADLLGRDRIQSSNDLFEAKISNKVIMVTGAGGSIGSELCRQIINIKPSKLILYEISESSLYMIHQELINYNISGVEVYPFLGSISDKDRLRSISKHFQIHTIYHAAAFKHVPLVEYNISQGVLNNIMGTKTLAEVAIEFEINTLVLISSDKAVRPANIMGAAKRSAELILQALSKKSHKTCFTMVRFGNVLGSSGSVIPLFKNQIKIGGPITVTHPEIVRYFMTIPEATELVIQAGTMAKGGDVFLLDMGESIKIYDLAIKMIELSGLSLKNEDHPNGDIEIKITGLRPGEKLYEELLIGDNSIKTSNPLIIRAEEEMIKWSILKPLLIKLELASKNNRNKEIVEILKTIVPDFKPQSEIVDLLNSNQDN